MICYNRFVTSNYKNYHLFENRIKQ